MEAWMNDIPAAVRASQQRLRAEVPDLAGRFARLGEALNDEVSAIRSEMLSGHAVPEIAYADIATGRVSPANTARILRRGCAVIRGVVDPAQIAEWNDEVVRYIDEVGYLLRMQDKAGLDKYFSALAAGRPQIFSLYWSKPQMQARQHPNLAATRAWLNRLWTFEKDGVRFFDPDRQFNYADRIRRREAGALLTVYGGYTVWLLWTLGPR